MLKICNNKNITTTKILQQYVSRFVVVYRDKPCYIGLWKMLYINIFGIRLSLVLKSNFFSYSILCVTYIIRIFVLGKYKSYFITRNVWLEMDCGDVWDKGVIYFAFFEDVMVNRYQNQARKQTHFNENKKSNHAHVILVYFVTEIDLFQKKGVFWFNSSYISDHIIHVYILFEVQYYIVL
jgi:hypothetical protein